MADARCVRRVLSCIGVRPARRRAVVYGGCSRVCLFVVCFLWAPSRGADRLDGCSSTSRHPQGRRSGNIGTTNAMRTMGKAGGAAVFVLDFGKGAAFGVPCALAACWSCVPGPEAFSPSPRWATSMYQRIGVPRLRVRAHLQPVAQASRAARASPWPWAASSSRSAAVGALARARRCSSCSSPPTRYVSAGSHRRRRSPARSVSLYFFWRPSRRRGRVCSVRGAHGDLGAPRPTSSVCAAGPSAASVG